MHRAAAPLTWLQDSYSYSHDSAVHRSLEVEVRLKYRTLPRSCRGISSFSTPSENWALTNRFRNLKKNKSVTMAKVKLPLLVLVFLLPASSLAASHHLFDDLGFARKYSRMGLNYSEIGTDFLHYDGRVRRADCPAGNTNCPGASRPFVELSLVFLAPLTDYLLNPDHCWTGIGVCCAGGGAVPEGYHCCDDKAGKGCPADLTCAFCGTEGVCCTDPTCSAVVDVDGTECKATPGNTLPTVGTVSASPSETPNSTPSTTPTSTPNPTPTPKPTPSVTPSPSPAPNSPATAPSPSPSESTTPSVPPNSPSQQPSESPVTPSPSPSAAPGTSEQPASPNPPAASTPTENSAPGPNTPATVAPVPTVTESTSQPQPPASTAAPNPNTPAGTVVTVVETQGGATITTPSTIPVDSGILTSTVVVPPGESTSAAASTPEAAGAIRIVEAKGLFANAAVGLLIASLMLMFA